MKIKQDFVTNSSSSSFLLVDRRENKKEPINVTMTFTLDDLEGVGVYTKMEDLKENLEYEELSKENKKKLKEIIKSKAVLINVPINSYGEGITFSPGEDHWENSKLPEGIEILGPVEAGEDE